MKLSRFNYVYRRDNEIIAYNTFSKALIILEADKEAVLKPGYDYESLDDDIFIGLKDNGFLIDDDFDELAFLKYYNCKARFATDYMCVTIAPTLGCNFDCPYCFENKREGKMSSDVQAKVIDYIRFKIENGVKILELTWYGGEPLICFDIIRDMTKQIYEIASENSVKIKIGMITNGYLLNEEIVDFLEKYKIAVQITLDGMKINHDARRYLKNGDGTFDRIFWNLSLFSSKNVQVYIRMNVDKYNKDDYEELTNAIKVFDNKNMVLYPAVTENINERIEDRENYYMSDSTYDDFVSITRKNGMFDFDSTELPISNDVGKVPDNRCYFCAAELENSCVIDEKGNVYKCWDEVGKEDYCFSLVDEDSYNFSSLLRYMGDHVFDDDKCSNCTFLPICFGGCKFHRYHLNRYACAFNEESIKDYIEDCLLE